MSIELQQAMGISDDACIGCNYDKECKCTFDGEPECIIDDVNYIYVDISNKLQEARGESDKPAVVGIAGVGSMKELSKWWEAANDASGREITHWNGIEIKDMQK